MPYHSNYFSMTANLSNGMVGSSQVGSQNFQFTWGFSGQSPENVALTDGAVLAQTNGQQISRSIGFSYQDGRYVSQTSSERLGALEALQLFSPATISPGDCNASPDLTIDVGMSHPQIAPIIADCLTLETAEEDFCESDPAISAATASYAAQCLGS